VKYQGGSGGTTDSSMMIQMRKAAVHTKPVDIQTLSKERIKQKIAALNPSIRLPTFPLPDINSIPLSPLTTPEIELLVKFTETKPLTQFIQTPLAVPETPPQEIPQIPADIQEVPPLPPQQPVQIQEILETPPAPPQLPQIPETPPQLPQVPEILETLPTPQEAIQETPEQPVQLPEILETPEKSEVLPTPKPTPQPTPQILPTPQPTPQILPTPQPIKPQKKKLPLKLLVLGDSSMTLVLKGLYEGIQSQGYEIPPIKCRSIGTTYTGEEITTTSFNTVLFWSSEGNTGTQSLSANLYTFIKNGGNVVTAGYMCSIYPKGFDFRITPFYSNQAAKPGPETTVSTTDGLPITQGLTFDSQKVALDKTWLQGNSKEIVKVAGVPYIATKLQGNSRLVGINAVPSAENVDIFLRCVLWTVFPECV
jgi:hypothetical protein